MRLMIGPSRFGLKHIEQVGMITPYSVACMYFTKIALVRPPKRGGTDKIIWERRWCYRYKPERLGIFRYFS